MNATHLRMPAASFVVARSHPGNVIGCENELPWRLPSDLKMFRKITDGHVIVMGRKTLESIGRPLPNRLNIVISRTPQPPSENVVWVRSPQDAVLLADFYTIARGQDEFFIIGGAEIYRALYNEHVIGKVYLTEVFCDVKGDAFFEFEFPNSEWKWEETDPPQAEGDEYPYRFSTIRRKGHTSRKRLKSEFLTCVDEHLEWKARFEENSVVVDESDDSQVDEPLLFATG